MQLAVAVGDPVHASLTSSGADVEENTATRLTLTGQALAISTFALLSQVTSALGPTRLSPYRYNSWHFLNWYVSIFSHKGIYR